MGNSLPFSSSNNPSNVNGCGTNITNDSTSSSSSTPTNNSFKNGSVEPTNMSKSQRMISTPTKKKSLSKEINPDQLVSFSSKDIERPEKNELEQRFQKGNLKFKICYEY